MSDYISREAAVEKITFLCELREIVCDPDDEFLRGLKNALNTIKSNELIPSTDVQPVRYGRWVHDGGGYDRRDNWYHCSECNRALNLICGKKLEDYPYCHCGARMDGDVE